MDAPSLLCRMLRKLLHPLTRFFHNSRAIGITLTACTVISLVLANTHNWAGTYMQFWVAGFDGTDSHHAHIGQLILPNSPVLLINDALMAVFFFLVGMEIKREMVKGQLASLKNALLPIAAAIGGMLVPAIIFALFNKGTLAISGWAIPTATDIAFTLGVASLLGSRIPVGLKVFITALAIIDDLLAIIVIALFYGGEIQVLWLLLCALIMLAIWLLNKKFRFGPLQWILGMLLWYCMFCSGIHATIAGVLFALMVPVAKLERYEEKLHIPVYFFIMPVFALANTAIVLPENSWAALNHTLSWGIIGGLVFGKPIGICVASWLLVRRKFAILPHGVNWRTMIGAGLLCGIGFTMSIFISILAFTDPAQQDIAKVSVLVASAIATIGGIVWLKMSKS
jgi:NhaA family Na+:H+ antiporter